MHHPIDRITHTTAFVTQVVEHWLEREIAQWVHHEGSTGQPNAQGGEGSILIGAITKLLYAFLNLNVMCGGLI